jgi:hypothetical protein
MTATQHTIHQTNDVADRSLSKVDSIAQRLDIFEMQTEHIAEGFAFLSAIPALVTWLFRSFLATIGTLFMFTVLYKFNTRLAGYTAGACSSAFLLHICGILDWLGNIPYGITKLHDQGTPATVAGMSSWQKGAGIVLLIWVAAYPVCKLNAYLGNLIAGLLKQLLGPIWVHQYSNDDGMRFLPSIEIPAAYPRDKDSRRLEDHVGCDHHTEWETHGSRPNHV